MNPLADRFPVGMLRDFTRRVFVQCGVPEEESSSAAEILLSADLRGIDSHGIARLRRYHELLTAGSIEPRPDIRIASRTRTTATVDGGNGLGLVVGPWANRLAIEMAADTGAGWVAVRRSNHYGIAGAYSLRALRYGMIGWSMTNAGNLVVPFLGAERMLGTNPISIAFPGGKEPPVVIDMSTAAVPYGKIQMARRNGTSIPLGWAVDHRGEPTTDPAAMADGGALLPLGSDGAGQGHKGYCLGAMVDVFCGVLPGAGWGPFAPHFAMVGAALTAGRGSGTGHFFGALRIDAFMDPAEFRSRVDDWVRTMRGTRPAPGTNGPLIPGDPERLAEAERRERGIPLLASVVEDLHHLARETGVAFG